MDKFRRTVDYLTDEGHTVEENITARGGAKRDIAGQRFGRLTAQRRVPPPDGAAQNDYWLCRCDCGNERTRLGYFRKFEDAVKARQVAEDDVFGEFRRQLETQREEDEASGRPMAAKKQTAERKPRSALRREAGSGYLM